MSIFSFAHEEIVARALREDLARGQDMTAETTVPENAQASAIIRSREDGVIAGLELAAMAFHTLDAAIKTDPAIQDGDIIKAGQDIMTVTGPARSVLAAERTALNFMTHLSGIASATARYVQAIEGTGAHIVCTRKTLPGLRALQKYAVRMGGGHNHRFALDDGILIKDNHIAIAGGIAPAIEAALKTGAHMVKIEVEVDTLDQLKEALCYKIDAVLLDNMQPETLKEAVALANGKVLTEASGGVNMDTVRSVAQSGVDLVSIGALTHSVQSLDLGLDIAL